MFVYRASDIFGVLGDFYVQWGELTLPMVLPTWSTPYVEPESLVQTSPRTPTCVFRAPLCVSLSSWMIGRCQKLDVSKTGFLVSPHPPTPASSFATSVDDSSIHLTFQAKSFEVILDSSLTLASLTQSSRKHWGPAFSVGSVCESPSCVQLFATPWTVAHQAPLSIEFSRQEYWSGLPFHSPGDLPNPEIEPGSPTLRADYLPSEPPGKPTVF